MLGVECQPLNLRPTTVFNSQPGRPPEPVSISLHLGASTNPTKLNKYQEAYICSRVHVSHPSIN